MRPLPIAICLLLVCGPAAADDWVSAFFSHSSTYRDRSKHHHHYQRPRYYDQDYYDRDRYRDYDRTVTIRRWPQVRGWSRTSDPTMEVWTEREFCKPAVRVVGIEAHSEEIARQRAIAQWSANARFQFGERYMDIVNARSKRFMCSRSTVPGVGLASEFKEGAANLLGKTADGIRCQVIATPCSAPEGEEVR